MGPSCMDFRPRMDGPVPDDGALRLDGLAGAGFRRSSRRFRPLFLQLGANALWSWIFFFWRQGALAFAEILLLWILLAATMQQFRRIRPAAALLLVPYLAWTTFAAVLAFSIWRLNPAVLG